MPGFQAAESNMAPMMAAISGRLISPRSPSGAEAEVDFGSPRTSQVSSAINIASTGAATMAVSVARWVVVQKKSTPRRKPTNNGGSPSGLSAPPILATRKMKKITTWVLFLRAALARISGRTRIMAAPVVPTRLAMAVPSSRMPALTSGPPRSVPVINIPPATT